MATAIKTRFTQTPVRLFFDHITRPARRDILARMIVAAAMRIDGPAADSLAATFALTDDTVFAAGRRVPQRRRQRLVARALLRRLLTDASGRAAGDWIFETL